MLFFCLSELNQKQHLEQQQQQQQVAQQVLQPMMPGRQWQPNPQLQEQITQVRSHHSSNGLVRGSISLMYMWHSVDIVNTYFLWFHEVSLHVLLQSFLMSENLL